ncbi:carboxylate--amine ligase [Enterococcus timonensis]|uniref:carboxylate--amine ligase n=1 Tax=Enterococcus timonensis TaxID=1852364 RepID=UPI0008DA9C98|nr:carboxylate--amine ligase [Enterococcus timonensis]
MSENFIPIIVGTDMNAYNMAISFHEEYGIRPILVGQQPLSFTKFSNIPQTIEYFDRLHDSQQFPEILKQVAEKYQQPGKKLLLVGTSDMYVRYIVENADFLRKFYVFNYPSLKLIDQVQVKANFYQLCAEHGVDYPATAFFDCKNEAATFDSGTMRYPLIIKPSDVIDYFNMHFDGKEKVYRAENQEQVVAVLQLLHKAGYQHEAIIQEFIPGDDTLMWDGVLYVSQQKKVQLVALGQVVLQEHTPTAIGNYTAILARYNEELMQKMADFLTAIDYTGFANFDMKYDVRDGQFKVFEINIRQGRSSYYVTRLGYNLARYLVDDCVKGIDVKPVFARGEYLFSVVPKKVLKEQVENPEIAAECQRLIREKKWGNPLFYKKDHHLKRKLYLFARQANYVKKYRTHSW